MAGSTYIFGMKRLLEEQMAMRSRDGNASLDQPQIRQPTEYEQKRYSFRSTWARSPRELSSSRAQQRGFNRFAE